MDYRDLINEAQELMGALPEGRQTSRKGAAAKRNQKQNRTPEQVAASKKQSEDAKAANKANDATKKATKLMDTSSSGEETGEETDGPEDSGKSKEPSNVTPKNIPAGSEETQKKYMKAMDMSKPLDAWVLALRCVFESATMPTDDDSKTFNLQMFKKLESNESKNEKWFKGVAGEYYEDLYEETDGEAQEKLDKKMELILNYVNNEASTTLLKKLNDQINKGKDARQKKIYLTNPSSGMIPYLYNKIAEKHPYVDYAGTKKDAEERGTDRADYVKACIYYRLYYIYIMYRFVTSIGHLRILADANAAIGFGKIKKLDNSSLGNASSEQSTFGTEKNVENIFVQAIKQAEQIELANITTMESFLGVIDDANRFLGEAPETPEPEAKETQVTKLPKVLTDFIAIMKMVRDRKAFTSEKFNDLIKSGELNKVDLMQGWLKKNEKISQGNDYLATALKFMAYSKMYGSGGDVGWAKTFAKRWPKVVGTLKAPITAFKIGKKVASGVKKFKDTFI